MITYVLLSAINITISVFLKFMLFLSILKHMKPLGQIKTLTLGINFQR